MSAGEDGGGGGKNKRRSTLGGVARRWNEGGNVWLALGVVALFGALALVSKRNDAPRMPTPMRRRVRELLRSCVQTTSSARHNVDAALALVQCDRVLATLDALEAATEGGDARLSAIAGFDVGALRVDAGALQRQALDAVLLRTGGAGGNNVNASPYSRSV